MHIGLARTVCVNTPYMAVHPVNSLPKILYTHRIYIGFWPTLSVVLDRDAEGEGPFVFNQCFHDS